MAATRMTESEASVEKLRLSSRPIVLFVSHGLGGGVRRHIADLAEALADHVEILLLQPSNPPFLALHWLRPGEGLSFFVDGAKEWGPLVDLLRTIGIDRVHFHHVDGLPQVVLNLPSLLDCPHDVTIHDFYAACPNYHLTDASGRYCARDPDCMLCLDARPAQWPLSIEQWRTAFAALLDSAARVIAPSGAAAARIRAFFPGVSPMVLPHLERAILFPASPVRVLVLGAMSRAKGLGVLESCARDAAARGLPLHFRVLGFLGWPVQLWPALPLSITGEYREENLAELMALERGDVVLFPSQCPETYSYTLSAAIASRLPIVATDLGALPERLAGLPAQILSWQAPAAQMNDALLAAARPMRNSTPASSAMSCEAYRKAYMAGISRRQAPRGTTISRIDPQWRIQRQVKEPHHPLSFLFQDGVQCGKTSSLEKLRHYAFDPDSMHADADARFLELIQTLGNQRAESAKLLSQAQAEAKDASARAHAAEEQLRRLEASTSWKLTSPLRRLARWLRPRA